MNELFFKEVIKGIQTKKYEYEIKRQSRLCNDSERHILSIKTHENGENCVYNVPLLPWELDMFHFLLKNYICEEVSEYNYTIDSLEVFKNIKEIR